MTTPVDYATPRDERPPVSLATAHRNLLASLVPAPVGLLILGTAYVGGESAGFIGIPWLLIGGLTTAATALVGLVGWAGTFSRSGDVRRARIEYGGAVLMAPLSCAAALFCFVLGANLVVNPPFPLTVRNRTPAVVSVAVHFSNGDVLVGPIGPGQSVASPRVRRTHQGPLDMTVTANGRSATTRAADYADEDDLRGGYSVEVDATMVTP